MIVVHRVDAFTARSEGGNPAGVVAAADGLTAPQMQSIASAMGFSETAFVRPHAQADREIRFFTPTAEVGLCGHATIASWHLLMEQGAVSPGRYRMWTRSGPQELRCEASGQVSMSQNRPEFGAILDPAPVARALGLTPSQLLPARRLPVQIASTGLHKIFAPIQDLETLMAIRPDLDAIETISRAAGAIGIYCYTLESRHGGVAQCRNFAPVVGISEDSATGTSAAATACLLYHHGAIHEDQLDDLIFEQGYALKQPSEIRVRLEVRGTQIDRVWVAGRAATRSARELEIEA